MKQKTKFKQTEIGKIPEGWEVDKLSNLLIIKGRIGWKGLKKSESTKDGECLMVNGPDIRDGKVNWNSCLKIPKWRYDESPEIMLKDNDILMTKDGTIGKIAFIEKLPRPATVASGIFVIRNNSKRINQRYLYQTFNSPYFKSLVVSNTEGSVIPHLYQKSITELQIPLPSLPEQKKIAEILDRIDAKIELNNKIAENLEYLGQRLFDKELVDLEKIPSGWETKPLDQIADFLNGLALQKYPANKGEEYLPAIKIRELKNGITDQTDKVNIDLPEGYIIYDGDVLFSWSGSLEVVLWTDGRGALNQHLFKVNSKDYPKWFYYYWVKHHLPEFQHIAKSKATTMGHIQKHHLTEAEVLIPDKENLDKLNLVMQPLIEKIISLRLETNKLSKIRDLLLPKLMSGEIRVE